MSTNHQELEAKFYINDLSTLKARVETLGAALKHPRVLEINLRFDTPAGDFMRTFRALRLRQDTVARVTYKGPGTVQDGARLREELEFTVSDFDTAKAFLEALGYQVVVIYEKYRTTYTLGKLEISLDEMPYGNFVEIEGPDGQSIQETASRLGLDWGAVILDSYLVLFDRLRQSLGLSFRDLTFSNFKGITITPSIMGVQTAM